MTSAAYFTAKEVVERENICLSTLYVWVKQKRFPAPYKFGDLSRFKVSEILAWEEAQPRLHGETDHE